MHDKYFIDESSEGQIKIADDIISRIALETAFKVDGVASARKDKGIFSYISESYGAAKTAKAKIDELRGHVDLYIAIDYGKNIIDVSTQVQDQVKEAIENMTDIEITEVNVHVTGLSIDARGKEEFKK
ncbi:MAG: Asp23/Gls24 family envelope stress response protein [Tissierellia bacterium]|nr:Asp23/Gls24 family envelope stress response protein [Tissierellia bacterium]